MKTVRKQAGKKGATAREKPERVKRGPGRPVSEEPPVMVSTRFDRALIDQVDSWARLHGGMGRSAAIRQFVAERLQREASEKSS